ncbi:MAG: hypothetical protein JWM06_3529 [Actinomycetia bacterium]|jgi:hypothetical protein|nr:hypothetical protein [Actinomycetes bacterium]
MILVAYACLLVGLGALVLGGVGPLRRRSELVVRFLGSIGAAAMASVALLLLSTNSPTTLGFAMLLMLLAGSMVYLCGLALWRRRVGFAVRLVGLSLTATALAIPSSLTLLLPLAALLTLTLRGPDDRALPVAQATKPNDV